MSDAQTQSRLGNWPDSCGEDGCLAHLYRRNNHCRCPRYKANRPGYHITRQNLDCPEHGPEVPNLEDWIAREAARAGRKNGSAPDPATAPPAVKSAITELLTHAEFAMYAEGIDPATAMRVLNRLLFGHPAGPLHGKGCEPTPEAAAWNH